MNTVSHGLGLVLSIAGLILLIIKGVELRSTAYFVSVLVFGLSLIMVYGSSTIYHYVQNPKLKHWCKVFDHVAIYFLIAGTYTPFTLITLKGSQGWWMFGIVWSLALLGTIFKLFFTGRFKFVSTLLYIAMGWLALVITKPLIESLHWNGFLLLASGGAVYTLGTLFYLSKRIPYSHAVWHMFVIGGSVLHYLTVFYYVVPNVA
mgnify:FL=1